MTLIGLPEAEALLESLISDPGSHTGAALAGWQYPLSRTAMISQVLTEAVINMFRDSDPVRFGWPWPDEAQKTSATPAEMDAAKRHLATHSAFNR